MILSYKLKKFYIRWRYLENFWEKHFPKKKEYLSPYQVKVIKLWRMLLRNPNVSLQFNPYGTRQIEHNDLMMIFNNSEFVMTIMDTNPHRKCVYEIHLPVQWGEEIITYFDVELSRRMRGTEDDKRSIIGDDLDALIRQEERLVNRSKAGIQE